MVTRHAEAVELSPLAERFRSVRSFSEVLARPLSAEDCSIQSMPDVSPTKWHLAHTTWFFETFVLAGRPDHVPHDERFAYLFNSYYNTVGKQYPRPQRGLISRPGLDEILAYRRHVDEALLDLLSSSRDASSHTGVIEIGLHHEQQHQELMLTDIKHVLSCNPLEPRYHRGRFAASASPPPLRWRAHAGGIEWIGHDGDGFAYDNEAPRHRVFLEPYELADRLVTCGEFVDFIEDGGYRRPELWLSMGWDEVQREGLEAPLYWSRRDGIWRELTLAGPRDVDPALPVCHVSYFEADAFARWSGARLPTEAEWEVASQTEPLSGHFVDACLDRGAAVHPGSGGPTPSRGLFGDVWEWTASPYVAYPGYAPPAGALGEYNGKFMCHQFVLRGGSCATSSNHIRRTYRNFFPPGARWQFTGLRLCR